MANRPRRRPTPTIIDEYEIYKNKAGRFKSLLALTRDSLFVYGGNSSTIDQFAGTYCWRCNRVSQQWSMVPVQVVGEAKQKLSSDWTPNIYNGCAIPAEDRVDGPIFLYAESYGSEEKKIFMISLMFNELNQEELLLEQLKIKDEDGSFEDKICFSGSLFSPNTNVQFICENANKFYCIQTCPRPIKFGQPDDDTYSIFCIYQFEQINQSDTGIFWKWRKLAKDGESEYREDMEFLSLNYPICFLFQKSIQENFLCFVAPSHNHRRYKYGQPHILSKALFFDLNRCTFFMTNVNRPPEPFPAEPYLFDRSPTCILHKGNSAYLCFFGEFEQIEEEQAEGNTRIEYNFKTNVLWTLDLAKLEWKRREFHEQFAASIKYDAYASSICDQLTSNVYIFGGKIHVNCNAYEPSNVLAKIRFEVPSLKDIAMNVLAGSKMNKEQHQFEPKLSEPRECVKFYRNFYE